MSKHQPEALLDHLAARCHDKVLLGSVGMLSLLLAVPISMALAHLLLGNVVLPQWALALPHLEWFTGTLLLLALAYMLVFGTAALATARVCSCVAPGNPNASIRMYATVISTIHILLGITRRYLCGLRQAAQERGALALKASLGRICLHVGRESRPHHIRLQQTSRTRDKEAGHVAGLFSHTAV